MMNQVPINNTLSRLPSALTPPVKFSTLFVKRTAKASETNNPFVVPGSIIICIYMLYVYVYLCIFVYMCTCVFTP